MVVMRLQTGVSTGEVCGNTSRETGGGGDETSTETSVWRGGKRGGRFFFIAAESST